MTTEGLKDSIVWYRTKQQHTVPQHKVHIISYASDQAPHCLHQLPLRCVHKFRLNVLHREK